MNYTRNILGAIMVSSLLVSCGGEEASEAPINSDASETKIEKVELEEDFVLPSTVQIGELFRNSGLQYASGITLDPKNAQNFNSTFSKYLGFGVYWADMTYCILNHQSQEARKYMNVVITAICLLLSEAICFSISFVVPFCCSFCH